MKKQTKKNINEMKSLVKTMPKTINESLNFEATDDMEDYGEEMSAEEPIEEPVEVEQDEFGGSDASLKAAELIDEIRKKALRAMAELADTPEDENYIMLKKVWQMTDRKPEQNKNEVQN